MADSLLSAADKVNTPMMRIIILYNILSVRSRKTKENV
jgi:hypothetical protein